MIIKIGDKTKKSMEVLCIKEYPFTEETLRSNFRSCCLKSHPDTGGSATQFHTVKEAYEHLVNLAITSTNSTPTQPDINMPNFKEGVWDNCPICKGIKTVIRTRKEEIDCPTCKGTGDVDDKCYSCKGTGKFVTMRGFNVSCKTCKGTGVKKIPCPVCNNERLRKVRSKIHNNWTNSFGYYFNDWITPKGKIIVEQGVPTKCQHCQGIGKVRLNLFNAVVPEGAILR